MNLAILEKFDEKTANGILAAVASATSQSPGIVVSHQLGSEELKTVEELVSAARNDIGLRSDDVSVGANSALSTYITKAVHDFALKSKSISEVLERAGTEGRAPLSLYRVEFDHQFEQRFFSLGLKRKQIVEAVTDPDDFQHLLADRAKSGEADQLSLFMKKVAKQGVMDAYWLVVQTVRQGLKQIANSAWRVYPDQVDLSKATSPVEVLRAFVETFGVPLRVGDVSSKFLVSAEFPTGTEIPISWPQGRNLFWSISHRVTNVPGISDIGIAFAVDLDAYKAALKRKLVALGV